MKMMIIENALKEVFHVLEMKALFGAVQG